MSNLLTTVTIANAYKLRRDYSLILPTVIRSNNPAIILHLNQESLQKLAKETQFFTLFIHMTSYGTKPTDSVELVSVILVRLN